MSGQLLILGLIELGPASRWLLIATTLLSVLMASCPVSAEATRQYNIPEQSLNDALMQFSADSGLELIFSADKTRGLRNKPLSGTLNCEQALKGLLEQTGFTYRFLNDHTVTLQNDVSLVQTTASNLPVMLESIPVYAKADKGGHVDSLSTSTATRTNTPLVALPQSVQILNRSLIDDQQNVTPSESLTNVSGLVPRSILFSNVTEGTYIRGFRAEQLTDGFTQYYNAGDRESLVSVEKIEVLKGSNAILYSGGSGAPAGGVISVISKLPKAQPFAEAGFKIGSHDFYQPYFDWNQPLNDKVWFRMTGEFTSSASAINVIDTTRFNLNPVLAFNLDLSTTLTLQGKVSRWQQPEYQGLPATGTIAGNFRIPTSSFIGPANIGDSYSDSDAVWAGFAHRFNRIWSVNIKARYADSTFDELSQLLVGSNFSVQAEQPLLASSTWGVVNAELYQHQQDVGFFGNLQSQFELGPSNNQFLLSVDHGVLNDSGLLDIPNTLAGTVNLLNPVFPAYTAPAGATPNQFVKNTTAGGALQWQSDLYQRFHSLLGLRLGSVEIDYQAPGIDSTMNRVALLPRIGGVIDITDTVSWFTGYSQGMRGQPFVNFSSAPQPETSRQIETGLKLAHHPYLSGQIAVYQIDRDNVATNSGSGPLLATGQQRSQGLEIDLNANPLPGLSLLANYTNTHAIFIHSLDVPAGNHAQQIPENTARFWAHYRFSEEVLPGWGAGFGVYMNSGSYVDISNLYKTAGYHTFDAAIAYETGPFKVAATAKNLSNEHYFEPFGYFGNGATGGARVVPSLGPAVYVTLSFKFLP